jgi:diguanylate cyclase (GGDEF)-like protein
MAGLIKNLFRKNIELDLDKVQVREIKDEIATINVERSTVYCIVLFFIELLLILFIDLPNIRSSNDDMSWNYQAYLFLHGAIGLLAVIGYLLGSYVKRKGIGRTSMLHRAAPPVFALLILIVLSVITGLDQTSTGSISAYVPGMLIVSAIILMRHPLNLIVFTTAHGVFVICMIVFQNNSDIMTANLINGSVIYIASILISYFVYENTFSHMAKNIFLRQTNESLEYIASHDILTGLPNRRYFHEYMGKEMARMKRFDHRSSLLILDIDHFKSVNDRHGHTAGDDVLKELGSIISSNIREVDLAARWGGEEFTILLTHVDEKNAYMIANRLREVIESRLFVSEEIDFSITVSIGLVIIQPDSKFSVDEAIIMADKALYMAKEKGRNRVCAQIH